MAAPTPVVLAAPAGIKIEDGHGTLLGFAADTDLSVFITKIKPSGISNGEAIDTTYMNLEEWETSAPRILKKMTECTISGMVDPAIISQFRAICGVRTTCTIQFADGSKWTFYGFAREMEFEDIEKGKPVMVSIKVVPTNWDPVNRVEADPVYTDAPGT